MAVNSIPKKDGRITKSGTFTVTINFGTGTTPDLDFDDFVSAIGDTVTKMTGATDVTVRKAGAGFTLMPPPSPRPTLADVLGLPRLSIKNTVS